MTNKEQTKAVGEILIALIASNGKDGIIGTPDKCLTEAQAAILYKWYDHYARRIEQLNKEIER